MEVIALPPAKKSVYFEISPTEAGFTDQLMQFDAFYKLGRSLGYTYIHKKIYSERSSFEDTPYLGFVYRNKLFRRFHRKLIRRVLRIFAFDVYSFLGFNEYLQSLGKHRLLLKAGKLDICIGKDTIQKEGISCFEDLHNYVRRKVERHNKRNSGLLVTLRLGNRPGDRGFFSLVYRKFPELPDNLSLYQAYKNKRKNRPWRSQYKKGKLRVLVHMRQGDTALLKTPWDTYIPLDRLIKQATELNSIECTGTNHINPDDYVQFVKNVFVNFSPDEYSVVFASDGFGRAFQLLMAKIKEFNYSQEQINALNEFRKTYDRQEFEKCNSIPNSVVSVGESTGNLKDLIHGALTADIIICGTQQRMMHKLISFFYDTNNPKIIISLYKNKMRYDHEQQLPLSQNKARLVDADLLDYDPQVVTKAIQQNLSLQMPD
ncbi:MAG: hypothetical protein ACN4GR_13635 [Arenicellales bacterium]